MGGVFDSCDVTMSLKNFVRSRDNCHLHHQCHFLTPEWVLQVILSLTVFSNCVSYNLNFDTAFSNDCTKFVVFFHVVG